MYWTSRFTLLKFGQLSWSDIFLEYSAACDISKSTLVASWNSWTETWQKLEGAGVQSSLFWAKTSLQNFKLKFSNSQLLKGYTSLQRQVGWAASSGTGEAGRGGGTDSSCCAGQLSHSSPPGTGVAQHPATPKREGTGLLPCSLCHCLLHPAWPCSAPSSSGMLQHCEEELGAERGQAGCNVCLQWLPPERLGRGMPHPRLLSHVGPFEVHQPGTGSLEREGQLASQPAQLHITELAPIQKVGEGGKAVLPPSPLPGFISTYR